jgi:hypothetical protein
VVAKDMVQCSELAASQRLSLESTVCCPQFGEGASIERLGFGFQFSADVAFEECVNHRYSRMKVLAPVGMTLTPKPFISASKAMKGLSRGSSASRVLLVSLVAFVATLSPPKMKTNELLGTTVNRRRSLFQ